MPEAESPEIRKWIIENDWLETIISLPDRIFFNTSITTYLWIVTNNKSEKRKGKVQLIDGSSMYTIMKRNLGDKGKYISEEQILKLSEIYEENKENNFLQIYDNNFFGYTKVIIEQPIIENEKIKTDNKGNQKPDVSKRDYERIPLSEDVDKYLNNEVKPYLKNFWTDRSKDKIGYEINFTKYFYKLSPLRTIDEISIDLKNLDNEIEEMSQEVSYEK